MRLVCTYFLILGCLFCHGTILAQQKSTAFYEVSLGLNQNNLLKNRALALAFLNSGLKEAPEREEVRGLVLAFLKENLQQGSRLGLFYKHRTQVRRGLMDLLTRYDYLPTSRDVSRWLTSLSDPKATTHTGILMTEGWIELVRAIPDSDQNVRGVIFQMLDKGGPAYFAALNFGYRVFSDPTTQKRLDDHVMANQIAILSAARATSLHETLQLNDRYWRVISHKKSWILRQTAERLFQLPVGVWQQLKPENCYALASHWPGEPPFERWLTKMMKAWVDDRSPAPFALLNTFIGMMARDSPGALLAYGVLERFFKDRQNLFVGLHKGESHGPLSLLNHYPEIRIRSLIHLETFLHIDRRETWDSGLLKTLINGYYGPFPSHRQRLFNNLIRPIYLRSRLQNPVRRQLLRFVWRGQVLDQRHRYKIAHHLFSNHPMNTPVPTGLDDTPNVVSFTVDVYTDRVRLNPEMVADRGLLQAMAEETGMGLPTSRAQIGLSYIDQVLGRPLMKLCRTFLAQGTGDFSLGEASKESGLLNKLLGTAKQLKYHYGLGALKHRVLEELSAEAVVVMNRETAHLHKDPGNKAAVLRIVSLIRLILKISDVLEDQTHLKHLLNIMRNDLYEVKGDGFVAQSSRQTSLKIGIFQAIHDDLWPLLNAMGRDQDLAAFYKQLYLPLRNLQGFFKGVGAGPYLDFVKRVSDKKILYAADMRQLNRVPEFLDAEEPILQLLSAYPEPSRLWRHPETLKLQGNITIGVLVGLLKNQANCTAVFPPWKNAKAKHDVLLQKFLDHMNDVRLMRYGAGFYQPWDFFPLLRSLLELHEIYRYPPHPNHWRISGCPTQGMGIRLVIPLGASKRHPMDGRLRERLFEFYLSKSDGAPVPLESLLELTLLLPNREANHLGTSQDLVRYGQLKAAAFARAHGILKTVDQSAEKLKWLRMMLRLETSFLGERNLGYQGIKAIHLADEGISHADVQSLLFEEFLLALLHRTPNGGHDDIAFLSRLLRKTLLAFYQQYDLLEMRNNSDRITGVILELFRRLEPSKVIPALREDDIKSLSHLISVFQDVLAAQEKVAIDHQDRQHLSQIVSDLLELYFFFLPYMDGQFDVSVLVAQPKALATFALFSSQLKEQMWAGIDHLGYEAHYANGGRIIPPADIRRFLIAHNFLPLQILESALVRPEVFHTLIQGQSFTATQYFFYMPAKRESEVTVSMEDLFGETLAGFTQNLNIMGGEGVFGDADYLAFLFGQMRGLFATEQDPAVIGSTANYDGLIRMMLALAHGELGKETVEKILQMKTLDEALAARVRRFPEMAAAALAHERGFQRILVKHLQSPFAMQKACEMALNRVATAQMTRKAQVAYQQYYTDSLFEDERFSEPFTRAFMRRFYPPMEKNAPLRTYRLGCLAAFSRLIDGGVPVGKGLQHENRTLGFRVFAESSAGLSERYTTAALILLNELFKGETLPPGKPFIGDLVWLRRGDGAIPKPFDMKAAEEQVYDLLHWIHVNRTKYHGVPKLRRLFHDDAVP